MRRWWALVFLVSFTFGCAPDGARERREAWSAFLALEEQERDRWAAWALAFSVSQAADVALYYASRAEGLESSAEDVADRAEEMARAFSDCRDRGLPLDQCHAWQEAEAQEEAHRQAEDEQRRMAFPDAWEASRAARAALIAAQERLEAAVPDAWARWEAADSEFRRVDPDGWESSRRSRAQLPHPNPVFMSDYAY